MNSNRANRALPVLGALALAALSCTGVLSDGGASAETGQSVDAVRSCRAVAQPMRALTARQYDTVVAELTGDTTHPAQVLKRPQSETRFDNHADWVTTDETLVRFYVSTAEKLANAVVANQSGVLTCASPAPTGEDACLNRILDTFARRAYRRSLSGDERSTLMSVFHTVRALQGSTYNEALSAVLQVVLQSPQFLYLTEVGTPSPDGGIANPLTGVELASKLSFFLWGSIPDDALLDAAEQGQLETTAQIAAQARRLMADPRAKQGFLDFAQQWLELDRLDEATKSPTKYPNWSDQLSRAAREESIALLVDTWANGGTYGDLMTTRASTVDTSLASLYGVESPTTGTTSRTLPENRAGILSRVGWLAGHAHSEETSPTIRGKAVRMRMLCETIPPPPPGVNVTLPTVNGPSTLRQRLALHVDASSACSGCHRLMDPIGFGFESFDAIGAFRTVDPSSGLPIDSSGQIIGPTGAQSFGGAPELAAALAASDEAQRCYLTQTYRYAQGRSETSKDRCHLEAVRAALPEHATLQDVAVGIVTSAAFTSRESLR